MFYELSFNNIFCELIFRVVLTLNGACRQPASTANFEPPGRRGEHAGTCSADGPGGTLHRNTGVRL